MANGKTKNFFINFFIIFLLFISCFPLPSPPFLSIFFFRLCVWLIDWLIYWLFIDETRGFDWYEKKKLKINEKNYYYYCRYLWRKLKLNRKWKIGRTYLYAVVVVVVAVARGQFTLDKRLGNEIDKQKKLNRNLCFVLLKVIQWLFRLEFFFPFPPPPSIK